MLVCAIEERDKRPLCPEPDSTQLSERSQRDISGWLRDKGLLEFMVELREIVAGMVIRNVSATDKKLEMA